MPIKVPWFLNQKLIRMKQPSKILLMEGKKSISNVYICQSMKIDENTYLLSKHNKRITNIMGIITNCQVSTYSILGKPVRLYVTKPIRENYKM